MPTIDSIARDELAVLRERGLLRALDPLRSPAGAEVETAAGERLINLSSNDYLGLASDPRLVAALQRGASEWGAGASASRLVCGDFTAQHQLEEALAAFEGTESALLFTSGYAANCGLLQAIAGPDDVIASDELNHASIIDGCRLARARVEAYPHRDAAAAESILRGYARRKFLVTDAIFSMDGDRAPLRELSAVCERTGAHLLVDEAHATGVAGPAGRGLSAELGILAGTRVGTLSKAFGLAGAYVAGSRVLYELLLNRARTLIFSTGQPPALAVAALESLRILAGPEGDERRARLMNNASRFADGLRKLGLPAHSTSAIQPVVLGGSERAMSVAASLRKAGVLAKAIRPPTVPRGKSRIRFALSAAHTDEHLDRALDALKQVL